MSVKRGVVSQFEIHPRCPLPVTDLGSEGRHRSVPTLRRFLAAACLFIAAAGMLFGHQIGRALAPYPLWVQLSCVAVEIAVLMAGLWLVAPFATRETDA